MAIYWAVHIRTLNGSNYSYAIMLLCMAVCFYILGYTIELNSSSQSQILFWNQVEYIGIPFVSALWLTTGLMYTGHFSRYKKILFTLIYVIPIITLILRFTNDYHHLYFTSLGFVKKYGVLFLVKKPGPWMYVQLFHSMLMVLVAMGLFIYESIKSQEKQNGKILFTIAASVFAVIGLILNVIKPFGLPVDYMACCLPITCVMVILAIAQYDLLETQAVARDRVFQASSDAILLINRQNKVLDYNNSAKHLFEKINVHIDDGYLDALFSQVPDLLEGLKKAEASVVKLHINAEEQYYDITTKSVDSHSIPRGWIKTIRNVTEIYRLNDELKKQAMTDALSTLNNRRSFIQIGQERISESNISGNTLHLIMMDLDHFKNVNDQYGHPAGDLVIQEFSQMLKDHFSADSLVARLGGEEFAVLHSGFSDAEMLHTLNALRISVEQHKYNYRNRRFTVTVSMGITKGLPAQTLESMMRMADKALYESKFHGRNCITVL